MTDKVTKFDKMSNISTKPVPMKLFAAWEVDRTPPNCIPRYLRIIFNSAIHEIGSIVCLTLAEDMRKTVQIIGSAVF